MSFRSLVVLAVIFALVGLGIYVAQLNRAPVTLLLPWAEPISAPLWAVCFLALLAGVFLALAYSLVLSSREAFDRWRTRRRERQAAELDRVFRDGVDAALHGRLRRARRFFDEVVERDPEHLRAWLVGGDVDRRLEEPSRALDKHLRAQSLAPRDPRVLEALAADYEALGETERARKHLEERLEEEPRDVPEPYERLRDLLARQGEWEVAQRVEEKRLKALGDAADVEGGSARAGILRGIRFEVGRGRLAAGKAPEAAKIFGELVKANEAFVPAWLYLGEARLEAGDAAAALQAWERGFEATRSLGLLERVAEHHLDREDPQRAIQTFHDAIGHLDANAAVAARFLLGRLYYRLEMVEEAEAEFAAIEEDVEFTPLLEFYLARLRERRGDHATAARLYREVIRAGGSLDAVYRCDACEATHDTYTVRCRRCERWGQVEFDASRTFRVAEETVLQAPPV